MADMRDEIAYLKERETILSNASSIKSGQEDWRLTFRRRTVR